MPAPSRPSARNGSLIPACCAALFVGGCTQVGAAAHQPNGAGLPAPDFQLDDLHGKRFRLSEHQGKEVVLLAFWATWCDPCKLELPHLAELYEKYRGRGFTVAAISIDGPESVAQVRGDAQQLAIPFPVLLDQETRVVALYNPRRSAPYAVLIGRAGRVVHQHEGYTPGDENLLATEIEQELGQ